MPFLRARILLNGLDYLPKRDLLVFPLLARLIMRSKVASSDMVEVECDCVTATSAKSNL